MFAYNQFQNDAVNKGKLMKRQIWFDKNQIKSFENYFPTN